MLIAHNKWMSPINRNGVLWTVLTRETLWFIWLNCYGVILQMDLLTLTITEYISIVVWFLWNHKKLKYFDNKDSWLVKMHRACRPGGQIVLLSWRPIVKSKHWNWRIWHPNIVSKGARSSNEMLTTWKGTRVIAESMAAVLHGPYKGNISWNVIALYPI